MADFEKKISKIEEDENSDFEQELKENFKNAEKDSEEENVFENLENESQELLSDVLDLSKESIDKISKEDIENLIEKQRSLVEKLENLRNDSEVCEKLEKSLNNSLDILEQLNKQLSNYKELALDLDLDSEVLTQGDENIGENDELDDNLEEKVYHFSREDFIKEKGGDDEVVFKTLKEFKETYPDSEIEIPKATYSRFLKKVKNNPDEVLEFKPRKTSFEEIEHKNPYDFIPEELKDNPNLVVFDKELFEMPNDEFMAKFNVSKNIKSRLINFYKENGYAWFLSQENNKDKVNRKYTCYSYENANKKEEFYSKRYFNWYREKYADQMDRINEILEGGREDDPIRYSAPVDDMIEIKLEDFFVDGITPKDIANKYPGISMQHLNNKVEKMIQNGYINTFIHKDGKNNMSVQTRKINFLEIDGKKSFPEWYNQEVLEKDIRLGKFFIIREHPVLREILEKYDDEFKSEAQTRLFELAGEEKFNDEPWRIQVVKSIGLHFLRKIDKLNKEISINTKNRENDDFSLMDTISAEKTGFEFEKNLIDEDTIEEVLYRIKAKNYDEYDKYEDDIEFVAEYLGQDYSTDAEDEEDRKRWEREAQEDKERFDKILKRNDINLEDLL